MDATLFFFASTVGAFAVGLLASRRRQKSAAFEAAILKLRGWLDAPVEYRMQGQSDAGFAALAETHPQLAELAACLRYLGDLTLVLGNGQLTLRMCVFVDATGLIVVRAIHDSADRNLSIYVESYSADCEEWVTKAAVDLEVRPPFSHGNRLALGTPFAETLASHQAFAPLANSDGHLATFRSLEDAANMYTRVHDRLREWRGNQPREDLLQMDLQTLLGSNYRRWGRRLTRRLQKLAIPRATVRRPSPVHK